VIALSTTALLIALAGPGGVTPTLDVKSIAWVLPTEPIVLGETAEIELTVRAERPDGAELDVAAPRLWSSTGSLTPPVRTAPGAWTTRFTPPTDRFPHVAILSATVDTETGPAVGFVSVPLWGKGKLAVKTKPKSRVVVYIGNTSFGPADADELGVAQVDIQAPPGPENAVAESTDAAGNVSSRTVPLSVPPFSRIALMAVDRVASADGTGEATLLVFIVDKKGAPLFDASSLLVRVTPGALEGAPTGLAPGLFRLRYRPGVTTQANGRVEVALKNARGSLATADVRLIPGGPVRAELAVTRQGAPVDTVSVDDGGALDVVARLVDKGGNATPPEAARFTVDIGRLEAPRTLDDDKLGLTWVLPDKRGAGEATITARSVEGVVIGSTQVRLLHGKPHALTMEPMKQVVADGRSAVLVRVTARDRAGNIVSSTGTRITTSSGEVVGLATTDEGTVAQFVPTPIREESRATLRATLGDISTEGAVRLVPPAQPFLSVKPGLRVDWNYGRLFAAGPDLSLLLRIPGLLDETLHVGVEVGWLPSVPLAATTETGNTVIRGHSALPFVVEGAWRPLFFDAMRVHVGGGLGATVSDLSFATEASRVPQRAVIFALGGHAALGVGYRLGPGEVEAMLRAGYFVPLASPSSFLGTPTGLSLTIGYRFGL
jgi:hypothetical protein